MPRTKVVSQVKSDPQARINLLTEDVITLAEAANMIPSAARPNVATLWRWTRAGRRGIKLESVQLGTSIYTSRQAFTRFLLATNK